MMNEVKFNQSRTDEMPRGCGFVARVIDILGSHVSDQKISIDARLMICHQFASRIRSKNTLKDTIRTTEK
jgi:hypothetical protein